MDEEMYHIYYNTGHAQGKAELAEQLRREVEDWYSEIHSSLGESQYVRMMKIIDRLTKVEG